MTAIQRLLKKRPVLFFVFAMAASAIAGIYYFSKWDMPIPGGIMVYRPDSIDDRRVTSCACGHDGYFLFDGGLLLWYVSDHESVQSMGTIVSQNVDVIHVERVYSKGDGEDHITTMLFKSRGDYLDVKLDDLSDDPEDNVTLKKTYLGPNVKKLVDAFWVDERQRVKDEELSKIDLKSDLAPILFVFQGSESGVFDDSDNGDLAALTKALNDARIEFYFKKLVEGDLSECLLLKVEDRSKAIGLCRDIVPEPSWTRYCAWNRKQKDSVGATIAE